jgi:hypothetical protein
VTARLRFALLIAVAGAACDTGPAVPPGITFDGARAMEYARIQVEAGPRIPGTETHRLVGDRIVSVLRASADTVIEQRWNHVARSGDTLPLRNIFAQFNPGAARRILYVTHWDTRPRADKAFAEADRTRPVPGANDGASGTALLLVLAEMLKASPPAIGVDLLFTDAEDFGDFDTDTDVLLGSKYFAQNPLPTSAYRPEFGILWDMIGAADPRFPKESNSIRAAPDIVERVWALAAAMGYGSVFASYEVPVTDDHVPLNEKGFRVIDVINDLARYLPHHTTQDTMDKLSASTLEMVGRVALAVIRDAER